MRIKKTVKGKERGEQEGGRGDPASHESRETLDAQLKADGTARGDDGQKEGQEASHTNPVVRGRGICAAIVEDLMRDPSASIFCQPVDPERDQEDFTLAEYLDVISAPMDLATVLRKHREGRYENAQQMRQDVVQVKAVKKIKRPLFVEAKKRKRPLF
jgi:hypothetical protein